MAISNASVFRVRSGGSNSNGAGYAKTDSAGSAISVLATTLNGSLSSGATTVVVASATGWPSSGNYYARIGAEGPETFSSGGTGSSEIVLVTGGQGTTSWTVTRGQLGTTAQAFASGIVVDNALNQANTASFSGSLGTSTASTTFTDAAGSFNETVVGNFMWIASGTGATVGAYLVTGYTNSTTITLDRASGTYTAGVWKIGGAWADCSTNMQNAVLVAGNVCYVRAGGSGSVASPDYTMPGNIIVLSAGSTGQGYTKLIGENGRPFIKGKASEARIIIDNGSANYSWYENLYLIASSATNTTVIKAEAALSVVVKKVVVDQNGFDCSGIGVGAGTIVYECEVFSSTANGGTAGTQSGITATSNYAGEIVSCNVHDCWGIGITLGSSSNSTKLRNSIIAKNRGNGINMTGATTVYNRSIANCTIDANVGHGIHITDALGLAQATIVGNIISNHTTAGKYGISTNGVGTLAVNDRVRSFIDYNSYYNNTSDTQNLTVGTSIVNGTRLHDNVGIDPTFTAQSTEDYSIGTALKALGYPQEAYPQRKSGQTTGVRSYIDAGGVQRQEQNPPVAQIVKVASVGTY